MGTLAVTELKSGMTLSEDLIAPNGRFILPKGACLTQKNIMSLKIWGISEVFVANSYELYPGDGEASSGVSGVMKDAQDIMLRIFGGTPPESRGMKEIYRVGVIEAARRLGEEESSFRERKEDFFLSAPSCQDGAEIESVTLEGLVKGEVELVSFPETYFRISEALQCPKSSITHIADLISKDTALSAALLKLANSAMYGVPARVDSISRAAALIGGNALSLLALGVSAVNSFGAVPAKWVNMEAFWKHSVAVAVFGQVLGARKTPRAIERIFVGGMLHDVGRLVLLRHAPGVMTKVIAAAEAKRVPLVEMEREMLGFDHAELGGSLLEGWGFPRSLSDLVRFHHLPEKQESSFTLAILAAADTLAGAFLSGSSGSTYLSHISDGVWDMMDLSREALDMVVRQTRRQIFEIYGLFKGGVNGGRGFSFGDLF